MHLLNFQLVVILLMLLDVYVYYKYMSSLFGAPYVSKRITLLSYASYYLILSAIYLFFNIPVVLMIYNIMVCTGITFYYRASFTKRILSSALYCLVMICIEFIYLMVFDRIFTVQTQFCPDEHVWQALIVRITQYTAAYILSIFFNKKNNVLLLGLLWFRITLIPIVSLCVIVIFLHFNIGLEKMVFLIIVILLINVSVIFLYVEMSEECADKYQHLIIKKQNEYYVKQFELMNKSIKIRNAQKHDFKNHLSVISVLVQKNEQKETVSYIHKIIDVYKNVKEAYNSGNLVIDSILNYKTQEAEQYGIRLLVDLCIPEKLQVNTFDMTTILGNIIDNAIIATKKLEKDKFINLKIRYDKSRLFIKIDNPFNGEIKYENNNLVTLHPDKEVHGIGLNNVRLVLKKYDGTIKIDYSNNIFSASLIMFV